jgi:hypothetical protein
VKCIVEHENLSDRQRLWDDFLQEEIHMGSQSSTLVNTEEEENLELAGKSKSKAKKKGSSSSEATSKEKKEIDVSKVKCLCCHKMGHFAS